MNPKVFLIVLGVFSLHVSIDCGGDSCSYPISLIKKASDELLPIFETMVVDCTAKFDQLKVNFNGPNFTAAILIELDVCGDDLHKVFDPYIINFANIFGTNATELVIGVSNTTFIPPVDKDGYPYYCVLENLRKLSIDLNAIAQKGLDYAMKLIGEGQTS